MNILHATAGFELRPVLTKPGRRSFVALAALTMAAGTVVFIEPAPYDFFVIFLLAAAFLLNRLRFHRSHGVAVFLLGGFLAANLFSMLNAQDMRVAIGFNLITAYLLLTWIFFVGFAGHYGQQGVTALLRGYTISGYAMATLASLAFFHLIPYSGLLLRYERAQGLFKDPNVFGPYVVSVLVISFAMLQQHRISSPKFILGLTACAISGVGIFLSFSRAAWINCAVSLFFMLGLQFTYGLMKRRISSGLLYLVLAIAVIGAAGAILVASLPPGTARLLTVRLGTQGLQRYDMDRFDTQRRAVEAVRDQPMGIGPGQSEIVFNYSTHSMYLRVLTESGVAGFVAFYAFLGMSFFRATRQALTIRNNLTRAIFGAVSACILGILVNGLVIDTIHWRHLWFLLGLAWWSPGITGLGDSEVYLDEDRIHHHQGR